MRAAFLLFLASLVLATPSPAHDAASGWQYEQFCCNGNSHNGDCQMISSETVRIIDGGYQVTLAPGDHRLATRRHIFRLPQSAARCSQDGEYHLCLYPRRTRRVASLRRTWDFERLDFTGACELLWVGDYRWRRAPGMVI